VAKKDSFRDAPGSRFWRLLGVSGQADQSVREQQQLLAWREALSAILVPRSEEPQVLERFCEITVQQRVAQFVAILQPDEQGILQTLAVSGPRSLLAGLRCSVQANLPEGQGPLGLTWREGRPFYSQALHRGLLPEWQERLARFALHSTAILPLFRQEKIWGLLLLLREQAEGWSSDSQMLLESTARLLSDVLEDLATQQLHGILGAGLRSSLDSVVLTNAKRRVLYVNQSFTLMTGFEEAEVRKRGMGILQGPDTSMVELASLDNALQEGSSWSGKLINYRRNGEKFWNHVNIIPIRNRIGELTHFLGILRDVSREQELLGQLEYESRHDRLTGLANRRALDDELELSLARSQRSGSHLAVCLIDLDYFKPINDLYGHAAGDHVLQVVSRRLRESLRRTDYVARLGGDEFVVLLEGYRDLGELELVLTKIEATVNAPIRLPEGHTVSIRLSMGICRFPEDGVRDPGNLLRYADQALYHAKALRDTRSKYWVFHQERRLGLPLSRGVT